ncbi:MAG: hypothetical protein JNL01_12120 [Bdellovibrionales bacterium]|nr:hypothetical protein [Bdellovibrionales bacterium]
MPKTEPKIIQKELEAGKIRSSYWLVGPERMKVRELTKRIRLAVLGKEAAEAASLSFNEERLEGSEVNGERILEAAQSPSLLGGRRLILVRDAHLVKDPEPLEALFSDHEGYTCVFMAKEMDGRKKWTKVVSDRATWVGCEDVPEHEREGWIGYLAKRRGFDLPPEINAYLRGLDPFSLDSLDQELAKYEIALKGNPDDAPHVILGGNLEGGTDAFLAAFFTRKKAQALKFAESFSSHPEESLPLLGLLSWNVKQLALVRYDQDHRTRYAKLSPFIAGKIEPWARAWTMAEITELQSALFRLDLTLKQTAKLSMGAWADLVIRFCR